MRKSREGSEPLIRVPRQVVDDMIEHARREAPNECCGLLVGLGEVIDRAVPASNLHGSPQRYLIDPRDQFKVLREARAAERAVTGAYHSHPSSPARPSETDLKEATSGEDFLYLIISLADPQPDVRAYRFSAAGRYREVGLLQIP